MRWDHSRDQGLLCDSVTTSHRLSELPVFTDAGLADLLDRYPREAIRVTTMGENPSHPNQLQVGVLGGQTGQELINLVRVGRLRIQLRDVVLHSPMLDSVVQRLCFEMMECQPGLRTSEHSGVLEISSPGAIDYFRIDLEPNVFWQVRGSRNVSTYRLSEPCVSERTLNQMIVGATNRPLYFEPAFDDLAVVYSLIGGQALGLPHLTPYRTVNDDSLNVALTTSYCTQKTKQTIGVRRVNHMLASILPYLSTMNGLCMRVLKGGLARFLDRANHAEWGLEPTFLVDSKSPNCVAPLNIASNESVARIGAPIEDDSMTLPLPALSVPGLEFEAATPISVSTEN